MTVDVDANAGVVVPPTGAWTGSERPPESAFRQGWRAFRRDRAALAGGAILLVTIIIALIIPLVVPGGPNNADQTNLLAPPGTAGHLLGTDDQGRDILLRILWGSRFALPEAILPVLVAAAISLALGLVGGYFQGILGGVIMRTLDVFFAIPLVLLGVAIAGVLGTGLYVVMISMTIVMIPYISRVVYTETALLKHASFAEAARICGSSELKIVATEMLPNVLSTVIVYSTTNMGAMIVFAAGFGFLGLGAPPPNPDWGTMISSGMDVMSSAPWIATITGLVIVIESLAFNYVGDGLRVALDPKLRSR